MEIMMKNHLLTIQRVVSTYLVIIPIFCVMPVITAAEENTYSLQYQIGLPPGLEFGFIDKKSISAEPKLESYVDSMPHISKYYHSARSQLDEEPKYLSSEPKYFHLNIRNETFTFVLDSSLGDVTNYDILYVDGDHNRDITETREKYHPRHRGDETIFAPIELQLAYHEAAIPYHISVSSQYNSAQRQCQLNVRTHCYRRGVVDIAGDRYSVALIDYNSDGLFNDAARAFNGDIREPFNTDKYLTDLNKDGRFNASPCGGELHYYGKYIVVDGLCYSLSASEDGARITIKKLEDKVGILEAPHESFQIALLDTETNCVFTLLGRQCKVPIPYGTYKFLACIFEQKDKEGHTWYLESGANAKPVEPTQAIEIQSGKTTRFGFGPPLSIRLHVKEEKRGNYLFGLSVKGQAGELYPLDLVKKDSERLPRPILRIASEDDSFSKEDKFFYG